MQLDIIPAFYKSSNLYFTFVSTKNAMEVTICIDKETKTKKPRMTKIIWAEFCDFKLRYSATQTHRASNKRAYRNINTKKIKEKVLRDLNYNFQSFIHNFVEPLK